MPGGRYKTLESGVGRVDVVMTSSRSVYESRLVVNDVTAEDAGLYICSLSTSTGHIASTHAYLTVYTGIVFFFFFYTGTPSTPCYLLLMGDFGRVS